MTFTEAKLRESPPRAAGDAAEHPDGWSWYTPPGGRRSSVTLPQLPPPSKNQQTGPTHESSSPVWSGPVRSSQLLRFWSRDPKSKPVFFKLLPGSCFSVSALQSSPVPVGLSRRSCQQQAGFCPPLISLFLRSSISSSL